MGSPAEATAGCIFRLGGAANAPRRPEAESVAGCGHAPSNGSAAGRPQGAAKTAGSHAEGHGHGEALHSSTPQKCTPCSDTPATEVKKEDLVAAEPLISSESPKCTGDTWFEAPACGKLLVTARKQHWERCLDVISFCEPSSESGINARDDRGQTALHIAAAGGSVEVCSALLGHSHFHEADAQEEICGWTALHFAAFYGHVDVCRTIIEAKSFRQVNAVDFGGCSAKDLAHARQHMELVKIFEKAALTQPDDGT
eukprot:gnl/TRDRNA2_/TRDRNA2_151185_c0_seq2.p1 gnl/TRDRNA2_/TRDRNA2_151185_c0~~gnl/TRDRNA2_/TRDRNA2_151185_c0_seq2.p1  ORF type:complete len:255 (-),score=63.94 gnl/TRDRNA2_/TRDRNA2_151185_c0_seq2:819-1583(-)